MSTIKNLWNSILQTIGTTTTNFGGLVTAQTPTTTDNSTNVATTAYVQSNLEAQSDVIETGTVEANGINYTWKSIKKPSGIMEIYSFCYTSDDNIVTITLPIDFPVSFDYITGSVFYNISTNATPAFKIIDLTSFQCSTGVATVKYYGATVCYHAVGTWK